MLNYTVYNQDDIKYSEMMEIGEIKKCKNWTIKT